MSNVAFAAHEVARSLDVFTNPASYGSFDLTSDYLRIVGCVDPRDEEADRLPIIMQTGGGAAGRGVDVALGLNAISGPDENIHTISDGLVYDSDLERTVTVAGGHKNKCLFIGSLGSIALEMAKPSDLTRTTVRDYIRRYELEDTGMEAKIAQISGEAARMYDSLATVDQVEILREIDGLYPGHPNIRDMVGENRAGIHITNHHPNVGLRRELVHRGEAPLTVHAYHDSLGAMVDSLAVIRGMLRELRGLRLATLFLRTAATRTKLCEGKDMKLLNVVNTKHGLQVQEDFNR